jgi:hypothetical protein
LKGDDHLHGFGGIFGCGGKTSNRPCRDETPDEKTNPKKSNPFHNLTSSQKIVFGYADRLEWKDPPDKDGQAI